MSQTRVLRTQSECERFDFSAIPPRVDPERVLMCTPDHFDVVDVKNAFMEGRAGTVDRARARSQWEALAGVFRSLGRDVAVVEGVEGLEDMVFCANQMLPDLDADNRPYAVLSRMYHPSRRREVPHFRAWAESAGYRTVDLDPRVDMFEGMGDAIWHPQRRLLWVGHGHRTSLTAIYAVAEAVAAEAIALKLVHPSFYHLDTALCALAPDAVMIFPGAFTSEGNAMVRSVFPRVVEVSEREATEFFACNALALGGRTVVLQRGAVETVARLRAEGFDVVEVDTSEFMKAGGSVFCMKLMIY